jgi:hypothetical protein
MICSDPSTAPYLPQGFAQDDKRDNVILSEAAAESKNLCIAKTNPNFAQTDTPRSLL